MLNRPLPTLASTALDLLGGSHIFSFAVASCKAMIAHPEGSGGTYLALKRTYSIRATIYVPATGNTCVGKKACDTTWYERRSTGVRMPHLGLRGSMELCKQEGNWQP